MNQQQFFKTETNQRHGVCDWIKPETNLTPEKKEKEEMVEIPVLGTIDSATRKITFFNKNEKI